MSRRGPAAASAALLKAAIDRSQEESSVTEDDIEAASSAADVNTLLKQLGYKEKVKKSAISEGKQILIAHIAPFTFGEVETKRYIASLQRLLSSLKADAADHVVGSLGTVSFH